MTDPDPFLAQIRLALDSDDPRAFADLLDPNVTWGAPGDPQPSCRNRNQVLGWYERGRADGRRARVLQMTRHGNKVLVATKVTSGERSEVDAEVDRWQVLTITADRICDIRGYDDELEATRAVGTA